MARVVLLTTGSMEELAFPRSLARLFPGHDFIARPRMDGFTSSMLPPDYAALRDKRPLLNIEKFAKTLIGLFAGGRSDAPTSRDPTSCWHSRTWSCSTQPRRRTSPALCATRCCTT